MLPRNHPDRIRVSFDDHRLVANAGLLLPATLAHHLGLRELVDHHLDLGVAPGRANTGDKMLTLVASRAGGRRLHRRRRCAARRWDGPHPGRHDQGAIHPGHLPAQFSLGPRPSTGSGEPGVAGTRLAGRRRIRRLAPDHRPGLNHLRDLRTGQGRGTPPRLYRQAGLSPAAGCRRRNRRTQWQQRNRRELLGTRQSRSEVRIRTLIVVTSLATKSTGDLTVRTVRRVGK